MNYLGQSSNIAVSNGNISVLQKKPAQAIPSSSPRQMGAYPLSVHSKDNPNPALGSNTYPDDVPDYPQKNTFKNITQYDLNDTSTAGYAPIVANKDGKPYFVVVAEMNIGKNYHGKAITISGWNLGKTNFDTNNFRLYAIVDGKYKDITNEPGVYLKSEYGNPMFDYSASKYTDDVVDFVAYVTYNDLSANYSFQGYLKYTVGDDSTIVNDSPGTTNISIIPARDNIGKSWIIAPDTTVYTDEHGNYTYNSGSLTNGVNVFKAVDGTPAKYVTVDNPQVNVANDENISDGQAINVTQQSTKDINLTYTSDGAIQRDATLHVINPYVSVTSNVTRSAKVNYVDSITGKVLRTDTDSSVFKATGLKDTRTNLVTWGDWSSVSGDGTYKFTVPTIDGYVPEDSSDVTGTLAPLGNDVTITVKMDPTQQVTDTISVPITAYARDQTKTVTTQDSNGTGSEFAKIDGYDQTKSATFTRTGTKNLKTGTVNWGNYTPANQSISFTAPDIPNYYLTSQSSKTVNISAPSSDSSGMVSSYLSFLYKPMSDVSRTTKGNVQINYIDEDTKQVIHDPYTKDFEFTQSGKKNDQTGETVWSDNGYNPNSQSYSVDSPNIDGYELVNPSQSTVSGTIDGGDDGVIDNVSYKKIAAPSSSATDSSAASSSEASQSSSAQSSAQSSSAESSAQSSSAQSSAQSSSSQSSAQISSTESSSQSSDAQSSAQSSSAQSSAQSSNAGSSASNNVVVPGSSSHDNHNGNPDTDKNETSTQSEESHKNNAVNPSAEHKGTTNPVNKDANRLPQTGDQTHENVVVAVGTALISIALGLAFFASRKKRK